MVLVKAGAVVLVVAAPAVSAAVAAALSLVPSPHPPATQWLCEAYALLIWEKYEPGSSSELVSFIATASATRGLHPQQSFCNHGSRATTPQPVPRAQATAQARTRRGSATVSTRAH